MNYPGGKNGEGVAQWIINQLPPHQRYIELFAGSGAVLRMKRPARSSIAIDIDPAVVAMVSSLVLTMPAVTVICGDAISYLRKLRCGTETLIYADPPYLGFTRRSTRDIYRFEFLGEKQHTGLLKELLRLDCMVAISGYRSSLYDAMLPAWRRTEKVVTLRNGIKATECLWMNYPEPVALHDYRYLGQNFRERERLKRIRHRWKERLARMPLLERKALSSMLAEFDDDGPP
jgi:site-specific DNA-adenine methylase